MNRNDVITEMRLAKGTDDFFACCISSYQLLEKLQPEERLDMFAMFFQMTEEHYFSKRDRVPISDNLRARLDDYSMKFKKLVHGLIDIFSPNGYAEQLYYQKLWDGFGVFLTDASEEEKGYCLFETALDRRTPYYELPLGLKMSNEKHDEIVDIIRPSIRRLNFAFNLHGSYRTETTSRMVHLMEELSDLEQKSVFLSYLAHRYEQRAIEDNKKTDESIPPKGNPVGGERKDATFLPISVQNADGENDSVETIASYQYPSLNGNEYGFALVKRGEDVYLTDQGKTLEQLDRIFELSEPDVIKNLVAILKQYGAIKQGNEVVMRIDNWDGNANEEENEDLMKVKLALFSCVSFMLNMRIFYV